MASTHSLHVAASIAMTRDVIDSLVEQGVKPRQRKVERALTAIERWAAEGQDGSDAASECEREMGELVQKLSARTVRERGDRWHGLRAWLFAARAVADLAALVQKQRSWAVDSQGVLDSCIGAVFSLDRKAAPATQKKIQKRLTAQRKRRLGSAATGGRRTAKKKAPKRRRSKKVAIIPKPTRPPKSLRRLGAVVSARLAAINALVDPQLAVEVPMLRAALKEHGVRLSRHLRELDERYGGLVIPDGDGGTWVVGAYACIAMEQRPRRGPPLLVPIVEGHDSCAFIDGKGVVWAQNNVTDPEPFEFAQNAEALLSRLVLEDMVWEHHRGGHTVRLDGKHGARIAKRQHLSLVRKACDASWRYWADASHVIRQSKNPDDKTSSTTVAGPRARAWTR